MVAALLFALFVVTGAATLVLLPARHAVHAPPQTDVLVTTRYPVDRVDLAIAQLDGEQYRLDIRVVLEQAKRPGTRTSPDLVLGLPWEHGTEFDVVDCSPGCSRATGTELGGTRVTQIAMPGHAYASESGGFPESTAAVLVHAEEGVGFVTNGVTLRGLLPSVTVAEQGSSSPGLVVATGIQNPEVHVSFTPRDAAGYQWEASSHGYGSGHFSYRAAGSDDGPPLQAEPISAVNAEAASRDSDHSFWAGLLAGVAGGALIGAVQELMQTYRLQRLLGLAVAVRPRR